MTLIAMYRPEAPIILSDVLLSHIGLPAVNLTPTGVKVTERLGRGVYNPLRFSQKTVLMHDNRVAFTGTGTVKTLQRVASGLQAAIMGGLTQDDLVQWLRDKSIILEKHTNGLVSWFDDDRFQTVTFGGGIRGQSLINGGNILYAGSGIDWFRRNFVQKVNEIDSSCDFDDLEMTRFMAVGQTGIHIAQERFMGLRDNFGGGFQVTYFDGHRFTSIAQILYMIFVVDHDHTGPIQMRLSGPMVIQRADGQRLAFELLLPESEKFDVSANYAMLSGPSVFRRRLVPPLLHQRQVPFTPAPLSSGEYINAQVLHQRDGKLIGTNNFQLSGGEQMTNIVLSGTENGPVELKIGLDVFQSWMTRFQPFNLVGS